MRNQGWIWAAARFAALGVVALLATSCQRVFSAIELTNNCGEPVDAIIGDDRSPLAEASKYPEMITRIAPGEVLKSSSTSKEGDFVIAVYMDNGDSKLISVPFVAADDPIQFSLEGKNCPELAP